MEKSRTGALQWKTNRQRSQKKTVFLQMRCSTGKLQTTHLHPSAQKKNFEQGCDKNLVTNPKAGSPSKRHKIISPDKIQRNPPRKYSNIKSPVLNDESGVLLQLDGQGPLYHVRDPRQVPRCDKDESRRIMKKEITSETFSNAKKGHISAFSYLIQGVLDS